MTVDRIVNEESIEGYKMVKSCSNTCRLLKDGSNTSLRIMLVNEMLDYIDKLKPFNPINISKVTIFMQELIDFCKKYNFHISEETRYKYRLMCLKTKLFHRQVILNDKEITENERAMRLRKVNEEIIISKDIPGTHCLTKIELFQIEEITQSFSAEELKTHPSPKLFPLITVTSNATDSSRDTGGQRDKGKEVVQEDDADDIAESCCNYSF